MNKGFTKYAYLLVMVLFGCLGPVVRAIHMPSSAIACLRAWIAVLALVMYIVISKKKYTKAELMQNAKPMLLSGALLAGDWIGLFSAYNHTTVAIATVMYYTAPVIVFICGALVLKEKLTLKHAVCFLLSFVGMIFVSGVLFQDSGTQFNLRGPALALLGATCYAVIIIINKLYQSCDGLLRTTIQLGVAAILTTPYVLLTTSPAEYSVDITGILLLLLLGIVMTAAAYVVYFKLILHMPARTIAIFSYADPVVAVIISACFMGESITIPVIAGSVLIIGAAIFSEVKS